jgi:hypothetical protein
MSILDTDLAPEQCAEADEAVWGPYRFRPGVDFADALGRAVPAFPLLPGGRTRLAVAPSPRPSWYEGVDGEQGRRDRYRASPLRLWATWTVPDHKPGRSPSRCRRTAAGPSAAPDPGRAPPSPRRVIRCWAVSGCQPPLPGWPI